MKGGAPQNPAKGEDCGNSKLTEQDVLEIRRKYKKGMMGILAREYGLTRQNISSIINKITWRHI